MGDYVEVMPEKLAEAESRLESLSSLVTGMPPPVWQGRGEGRMADEMEALSPALTAAASAIAEACGSIQIRIRTIREAITETDRALSGGG